MDGKWRKEDNDRFIALEDSLFFTRLVNIDEKKGRQNLSCKMDGLVEYTQLNMLSKHNT